MKKLLMLLAPLFAYFMEVMKSETGAVLNYASIYQQGLTGQKFTIGVKFSDLYDPSGTNTNQVKFTGGKTVQISVLTVTGMTDHDRDNLSLATRNYDNSWEPHTLSHDRKWETLVDPADVDETNMASTIGNITSVFTNEQLFPELDKYMSEKLFAGASAGNKRVSTTYPVSTADEVVAEFDAMMSAMTDNEIPEENRILYIRPAIYQLLKNGLNVRRSIGTSQATQDVNRNVKVLDDVRVIQVPSARMKESYVYTVGAVPSAGADDINMILVHPKAILAPIKVDEVFLDAPSAKTQGKSLYYQRKYWDVFVLAQKANGLVINYTAVA